MVNTQFDFKDVTREDVEYLLGKLNRIESNMRAYDVFQAGLKDMNYEPIRADYVGLFVEKFNKTIEQYVRGELKKPSAFAKINDDDDDFI